MKWSWIGEINFMPLSNTQSNQSFHSALWEWAEWLIDGWVSCLRRNGIHWIAFVCWLGGLRAACRHWLRPKKTNTKSNSIEGFLIPFSFFVIEWNEWTKKKRNGMGNSSAKRVKWIARQWMVELVGYELRSSAANERRSVWFIKLHFAILAFSSFFNKEKTSGGMRERMNKEN